MLLLFSNSRYILELNQSEGIHDLGAIKWDMALCLLVVYLICYFSLWKGISTSGKVRASFSQLLPFVKLHSFFVAIKQVVWFTALFPYAVLFILLIRGITLPGSAEGIKYYLYPNFDAIYKAEV